MELYLRAKLRDIVDEIIEVFDIERCSLMIRGETNALEIIASKGITEDIVRDTKISEGEGIAGLVFKEGIAILEKNIEGSKIPETLGSYKTSSFLSVPIRIDSKVVGVINITDKKDSSFFDEKDVEAIESFSDKVSYLISGRP